MAKAGNAVIGALRVSLGIDTAQFEQGLKSARAELSGFAASIKGPLLAIGAAAAAAFGGFAAGVKTALDAADDLSKASQKFGVPIEQLSALKYAADLAGVSFEALGTGLKKLSQSIAAGNPAFAKLGVSIKDAAGNLRQPIDVLLELADVFSKARDSAGKTAAAIAIFGKSGADLIPFLNQGAAGIKSLTDEARELGLVIDKQTGKAAEDFNDNLSRLHAVVTGIFTQVAAGVAGPLRDFTNQLVTIAKQGDLAANVVGIMQAVFKSLGPVIVETNAELERFARIVQFINEVAAIFAENKMEGAFSRIGEAASRLNTDMQQIATQTQKTLDQLSHGSRVMGRDTGQGGALLNLDTTQANSALDNFTTKVDTAKKKIAAPVPLNIVPEGFAKNLESGAGTYNDMLDQTKKLWQDIAGILERGVLNTIDDLIDGTLSWKSALKDALSIAKSIINAIINSAVQQSFASPTGLGSLVPHFATGGSFKVGGSGGIDSQLVAFRATPGESVSVSKPGQSGGYGNVRVYDYSGNRITTRETQNGNMRDLELIIDQRIAQNTGDTNSATSRLLGARGAPTPLKRR